MAIIDEFMRTAQEVGSTHLVEKGELGVSSATIRSEMVRLMNSGLLEKSHVSSGRVPTDQAIRLYVKEVSTRPGLAPDEAVQIRQGIFRVRFSQDDLVREILKTLVRSTNSTAFIVTEDSSRYYGASSLMKYNELREIETLERALDVLEDVNLLQKVFSKYDGDGISLLIGSESGIRDLEDCAIAFTKTSLWDRKVGHMGVIGSKRMNYSRVLPALNAVKESVENSLKGWN